MYFCDNFIKQLFIENMQAGTQCIVKNIQNFNIFSLVVSDYLLERVYRKKISDGATFRVKKVFIYINILTEVAHAGIGSDFFIHTNRKSGK